MLDTITPAFLNSVTWFRILFPIFYLGLFPPAFRLNIFVYNEALIVQKLVGRVFLQISLYMDCAHSTKSIVLTEGSVNNVFYTLQNKIKKKVINC